jgi:hypothetical protein
MTCFWDSICEVQQARMALDCIEMQLREEGGDLIRLWGMCVSESKLYHRLMRRAFRLTPRGKRRMSYARYVASVAAHEADELEDKLLASKRLYLEAFATLMRLEAVECNCQ